MRAVFSMDISPEIFSRMLNEAARVGRKARDKALGEEI